MRTLSLLLLLVAGCARVHSDAKPDGKPTQAAPPMVQPAPPAAEAPSSQTAPVVAKAEPTPPKTRQQGTACDEAGKCDPGLTCIKYYGIAGARGPEFSSCEIRCGAGQKCPAGQQCTTVADGPGSVCRPGPAHL